MAKPLIFLFTCVYNDRNRITKLFNSIENQTSNNFIYYLYDDCSSESYDDIFEILHQKLARKGIKSYYEKGATNLGINKATEHCLQILRDKFQECTHFVWINSDDWLTHHYIEVMCKYIENNPSYALYIPNIFQYSEKNNTKKIMYSKSNFKNSKTYLRDLFYYRQIFSHFIANKNHFLKINPNCLMYDNSSFRFFYNDNCVLFLLSVFGYKSMFINRPLSYFLVKTNNASKIEKSENFTRTMFIEPFRQYIINVNKAFLPKYDTLIKIVFTYAECKKIIKNKNYCNIKQIYKKRKEALIKLGYDKYYLDINNRSTLLFKFPKIYYLLYKIKYRLNKNDGFNNSSNI